jgi:hypothetical protein
LGVLSMASTPSTGTSAGVTVLQFSCTSDPANQSIVGPNTFAMYGSGYCDGTSQGMFIPVPAVRLYRLRVSPNVGTLDGSIPKVTVTVYDGVVPTSLTCTSTTLQITCNDFSHQVQVKSGDRIWIGITLPDSNTWMGAAAATVEEAVLQ